MRMLYGDHGPYIELIGNQICWDAFPHCKYRGKNTYFDYYWTQDKGAEMYLQKKSVKDKPTPRNQERPSAEQSTIGLRGTQTTFQGDATYHLIRSWFWSQRTSIF
eukprot:TRINITY_DN2277_c1_g1_i1.p3 TRINITY_DN2277_c1_g1~~TRINITY_DN2277_c1_g1_i1.p3  ORF type:complete len:105 (+),score=3.84 TRINITY_DN2277_c1_g1_i1:824-1138(+)